MGEAEDPPHLLLPRQPSPFPPPPLNLFIPRQSPERDQVESASLVRRDTIPVILVSGREIGQRGRVHVSAGFVYRPAGATRVTSSTDTCDGARHDRYVGRLFSKSFNSFRFMRDIC